MRRDICKRFPSRKLIHGLMAFVLLFFLMAPSIVWSQEVSAVYNPSGIWYVDGDKMTSGDGTSWFEAFKTIQEAIDASPGWDEIWVKKGTYAISSTIVFDLWDDEHIYTGFAGGETQRDERDWKTNVTIIDGQHSVQLCVHIVDCAPTIDGFIITGAGTGGAWNDFGGMLLNNLWSRFPTITNCTFRDNWASGWDRGGAITNFSSSPRITNCTFTGNAADQYGYGGAIRESVGTLTLTNSILWGDTDPTGEGSEIFNDEYSPSVLTVTYCDIDQDGYAGSDGNIRLDPRFVNVTHPDSANWDLHLQANSPCIDAGTATGAPDHDIEGTPRPVGAGYDMGAYESVPTGQPDISVSPTSHDFGDVIVGESSAPLKITISNTGTADLNISGMTLNTPFLTQGENS